MARTRADSGELTALLIRWSEGDEQALDRLTPIIYHELKLLARLRMSRERPDHTLQPTALVHELYIRLVDERTVNWQGRAHFFGVAAKLMRCILVDHARKKKAAKRSGAGLILTGLHLTTPACGDELLAVDHALSKLEAIDSRKALVVERKYFGGMTTEETAHSLAISVASVERDWTMAKAWLYRELKGWRGAPVSPSEMRAQ